MRVFCTSLVCFFCLSLLPIFPAFAVDVEVTEFLSNPVGDDALGEWIEVRNVSNQEIDLFGWLLIDTQGTPHQYVFGHEIISPNQYQVVSRAQTSIVLNNDMESIVLSNPLGETFVTPMDEKVVEGQSFSVVEDVWVHTTPSPGLENPAPSPTPTPTVSPTPTASPSVSPSPTPTASPVASHSATPYAIALSEFHACDGPIEWVEFYNYSNQPMQLDQWKIIDRSNQSRLLQGLSVPSKGFAVKEWPAGFLNNSGDTISLVFDGQVIESFAYDACLSTMSWAKNSNSIWQKTSHITKGTQNVFDEEEKQEQSTISTSQKESGSSFSKSENKILLKNTFNKRKNMQQELRLAYASSQSTPINNSIPPLQQNNAMVPPRFASVFFLLAAGLSFSGSMATCSVTFPKLYAWYTVSI